MADENIFSISTTTHLGRKVWTIEIMDTGETIIAADEKATLVQRHYNPEGGQNSGLGNRDEAIGEVFVILATKFVNAE